jgi:hypothetical protein
MWRHPTGAEARARDRSYNARPTAGGDVVGLLPRAIACLRRIKYRIRAKKIGDHPLTVTATGSKMSDAIKRVVEIVPDGTKIEVVASDRLSGNVSKTLTIPAESVADASKILVKIHPGVFSQVLEGTEGMLRLPGG